MDTGLKDKNGLPVLVGNVYYMLIGQHKKFYKVFKVKYGFAINRFQCDFHKDQSEIEFFTSLPTPSNDYWFCKSFIQILN